MQNQSSCEITFDIQLKINCCLFYKPAKSGGRCGSADVLLQWKSGRMGTAARAGYRRGRENDVGSTAKGNVIVKTFSYAREE